MLKKKEYTAARVERIVLVKPINLLTSLSIEGNVDDFEYGEEL